MCNQRCKPQISLSSFSFLMCKLGVTIHNQSLFLEHLVGIFSFIHQKKPRDPVLFIPSFTLSLWLVAELRPKPRCLHSGTLLPAAQHLSTSTFFTRSCSEINQETPSTTPGICYLEIGMYSNIHLSTCLGALFFFLKARHSFFSVITDCWA